MDNWQGKVELGEGQSVEVCQNTEIQDEKPFEVPGGLKIVIIASVSKDEVIEGSTNNALSDVDFECVKIVLVGVYV